MHEENLGLTWWFSSWTHPSTLLSLEDMRGLVSAWSPPGLAWRRRGACRPQPCVDPSATSVMARATFQAVFGSTAVLSSCHGGFLLNPEGFLLLGFEVRGG